MLTRKGVGNPLVKRYTFFRVITMMVLGAVFFYRLLGFCRHKQDIEYLCRSATAS